MDVGVAISYIPDLPSYHRAFPVPIYRHPVHACARQARIVREAVYQNDGGTSVTWGLQPYREGTSHRVKWWPLSKARGKNTNNSLVSSSMYMVVMIGGRNEPSSSSSTDQDLGPIVV